MIIVEGIDHVCIAVTDLSVSSKFYTELFDFEIIDDSDKKSILMSLDPIKIKLYKIDKVENQLTSVKIPTLSFAMDVDDFTDAITEIEDKKIKIVKGPENYGGGDGEALVFSDPDGNLIEIYYEG